MEKLSFTSPWLDRVPDAKRAPALSGTIETDVVVVGAGIVGVMTAKYLLEKGFRVVLLEKNHIATGDTGATTGFLTRVPDASITALRERYGAAFVAKLFELTGATQRRIFDLITAQNIDCEFRQCDSYFGSYVVSDPVLRGEWNVIQSLGVDVTRGTLVATRVPLVEAVRFANEGAFNVRKFIFAVLERFDKQKIQVFEESEVIDVIISPEPVEGLTVKTEGGTVRAKKIVCTTGRPIDAFAELQLLLELKLTYVIAAQYEQLPISQDLFWDTFDPYFYYRAIGDNTVIVGGADIVAEKAGTQKPYEKLEQFLREHLPGNHTITNQWSGSIFHTSDGLPYAFEHPHHRGKVYVGTGFGGNGMVMGMMTAEALAELVAGQVSGKTKILALERTGVSVVSARMPLVATRGILAQQWVPVADVADFAKKSAIAKKVGAKTIAVFKIGGAYHAIDNVCTHAGGSLSDGEIEEKVVQCPLHGAKFDVTTGEVVSAPAIRRVAKYPLRVTGTTIEVQMIDKMPMVFDMGILSKTRQRYWKSLIFFSIGTALFWIAQFSYQYFVLIPRELSASFIRSFALTGTTLISAALFSSALFKWIPQWAQYWRYRRYLGVSGFVLIVLHVLSVLHFYFNYDLRAVYWSFNPFANPIVFGSFAFILFFVMAATSTDWAVDKLTPKVWKRLHRVAYFAYWAAVFHFTLVNPLLLKNPAGYFLLVMSALVLFGQLYWFIRIASKKHFKSLGALVGAIVILLYAVAGYLAYRRFFVRY